MQEDQQLKKKLEKASYRNTKDLTYDFTEAKVIKVYDGDSYTIAAIFKGDVYKFNVRLYGVDTPEIKGGSKETNDAAKAVKKAIEDLMLDKIVQIKVLNGTEYEGTKICEKYGRLLCLININGRDLATDLVEKGLAKQYFGGTKV